MRCYPLSLREKLFLTSVGLLFLTALTGLSGAAISTFYAFRDGKACLDAGYPEYKQDWRFNGYCLKRVDQTDVVVPVEKVSTAR